MFQDPTLDGYLTAEQNLKLHAELYGVQSNLVAPRMEQVMTMVGLWDRKDSPVGTFSGGMRRRLEIARGLMHSPRVLFLDEPTIGLDPQTRRSIWTYIRELKEREEITIFMTTHYMDEAEWCDRIAIMDHGQIVALDAPETLKAQVGTDRVTIHTDDDDAAIAALAERFGIEARISEGAVTFGVPGGEEFVPRLFAELGVPIKAVSVSRPTLDDVFMSYTGTHDPRRRGGPVQASQPRDDADDAREAGDEHQPDDSAPGPARPEAERRSASGIIPSRRGPAPSRHPPGPRSSGSASRSAASPRSCARSRSSGGAS